MNYHFLRVLHLIKLHGSFSYPFINSVLKNGKLSGGERTLLTTIKYMRLSRYKDALDEIKKGLRGCYDKNLKYLLKTEKIDALRLLGRKKRAEQTYQSLIKNLTKISPSVRDFVVVELASHRSFFYIEDPAGKINKDGTCLNDSAKAFIEISVGRNLVKNGNVDGLEHFKKALTLAKSISHPSGMIDSLNALAWYGLEYDSDEAAYYAKEALYWMGWYYEKPKLYVFDTALEIAKRTQDISIYHVAKDFIFFYELSTDEEKQKYKKRLTQAKRILSTTFYKSDGKTRRFLKKISETRNLEEIISRREVFNLLHSKVKNVRGETIRKIISANYDMIKDMDFPKLPGGLICEMIKKEKALQDGIYSVMNGQKSLDPFVQARKDLVKAFLERIPKGIRERFINVYTNLEEEDKSVIDRFARDYIRYDIRWEMRVDVPDSMKKYTQAFHFKEPPAALAYWALDTQKEREKLLEVLEKFEYT